MKKILLSLIIALVLSFNITTVDAKGKGKARGGGGQGKKASEAKEKGKSASAAAEARAEEARQLAIEHDQASAEYLSRLFGIQWDDFTLYHILINTGKLELEVAAQIIVDLVGRWQAEPMS